jgi:YVTN family beta-propeller protein
VATPIRRACLAALALTALAGVPTARAAAPLSPSVVGEPPSAGGVFRFPQAVTFSPGGGTVYVGDQYSGTVQAFDPGGGFRFALGSRATRREPGRLGVVGGVATDHSGHVYVLDSENDRVQIFSAADGRYLAAFGDSSVFDLASATPNVNGGISASGIAVTQAGASAPPVVYVADQGRERVDSFTLDPSTLMPTGPPLTSAPGLGLSHPQGIALDPAATRVYVADDDNDRVVVLDPQTLAFVAQVGSHGTGPGQFQNPYDVAVDAHQPSQLYVADNLNNRVDVFDAATLGFVRIIGGFGRTVGLFSIVRAVGALGDDPRGGVDVADTANNRIQALDADGGILAAWGLAGRGPGYVTRPRGVAFTPSGGVAVADTFDHRIERFDPDGTYAGQLGLISAFTGYAAQGPAIGQLSVPAAVAYDTAGNTWVADTGNDRVVEFDGGDAVLFTTPPRQLSGPQAVAPGPAGSVYVADTGHGSIVQLLPDRTTTTIRTGLLHPAAVAWNGAGRVFAADDASVLDAASGTQVAPPPDEASWDHPGGLAVDQATGTLFVSERRPGTANGARVVRGTPAGTGFTWDTVATEGAGSGQAIEPAGLALSADGGTLLVADAGNNRVLRFDAPGYAPPQPPALTVSVDQMTRGVVTSDLPGISCATDCVQHYGAGRQVTLTATSAAGSVLAGWTGACAPAGAAPTCTVTMDGAQAAGASFAQAAPPAPPAPPPPPQPVGFTSARMSTHRLHLARPADRRHHRPASRATRALVTVRLTQPATLTIGVQQGRPGRRRGSQCVAPTRSLTHRPRCTRFVALRGTRTVNAASGTVTFAFRPVFGGRPLPPGVYRLALVALDRNGNRVGPVTVSFRVTR